MNRRFATVPSFRGLLAIIAHPEDLVTIDFMEIIRGDAVDELAQGIRDTQENDFWATVWSDEPQDVGELSRLAYGDADLREPLSHFLSPSELGTRCIVSSGDVLELDNTKGGDETEIPF